MMNRTNENNATPEMVELTQDKIQFAAGHLRQVETTQRWAEAFERIYEPMRDNSSATAGFINALNQQIATLPDGDLKDGLTSVMAAQTQAELNAAKDDLGIPYVEMEIENEGASPEIDADPVGVAGRAASSQLPDAFNASNYANFSAITNAGDPILSPRVPGKRVSQEYGPLFAGNEYGGIPKNDYSVSLDSIAEAAPDSGPVSGNSRTASTSAIPRPEYVSVSAFVSASIASDVTPTGDPSVGENYKPIPKEILQAAERARRSQESGRWNAGNESPYTSTIDASYQKKDSKEATAPSPPSQDEPDSSADSTPPAPRRGP